MFEWSHGPQFGQKKKGSVPVKFMAAGGWRIERGGVLEPGVLRPTTTALRLADMDRDGVDATVMYGPIVPLLIKDPALRQVCYQAYNEWLAEFCACAPDRLVGVGLIPFDDPKMASDYPHADSTWPDSQKAIEENFREVTPQARARILCGNARELYGLGR